MHRAVLLAAVGVCVVAVAGWERLGHGTAPRAPVATASEDAAPLEITRRGGWSAACQARATQSPTLPVLVVVRVENGGPPGCGDGKDLTTVTPAYRGDVARATVRYTLAAAGVVQTQVCADRLAGLLPVWSQTQRVGAGSHSVTWTVPPTTGTGTYAVSLSAVTAAGSATIGPCIPGGAGGPVVRVVGIDAAFARRSYTPGAIARLSVAARANTMDAELYRVGAGRDGGNDVGARQMLGRRVAPATSVAWRSPDRVRRGLLDIRLPPDLPSGLYALRLSASGQVGYAPIVVRPARLGTSRLAVVAPTNTWSAYNFADPDGDGLANTWYAGALGTPTVQLGVPFISGGAPPHWYRSDFLAWMAARGLHADVLTDDDLDSIADARQLARAYSAIIFAGHEEYVTTHVYDLIEAYRDYGGNLAFLSANSLFWRVTRTGSVLRRIAQWRTLGRPESAVVGVQYVANDAGKHRGPYRVTNVAAAPWLFHGTGLQDGSTFGSYGVEFDMRSPVSPAGTALLAQVDPGMPSGWVRGEMTLYRKGRSEVFAAGTESFFDATTSPVQTRLLENLWNHWASDAPPLARTN
jgi:hypothetical protein